MKKKAKSSQALAAEGIHFRPGKVLGQTLDEYASAWGVTPSEAARRMVSLTIRGLSLQFCEDIARLMGYMYGSSFDEACHLVHVAILSETERCAKAKRSPPTEDDRLAIVKVVVRQHEAVFGLARAAEEHQKVYVRRTD
jgi:hypothetical protein